MIAEDMLLQQRFADLRPGLELVAIEDAALPVTVTGLDVLAQERKPLPLLDEFVLRLVHGGVQDVDEIAGMLGLDVALVESTVADEVHLDHLNYTGAKRAVRLTTSGRNTVRDLEAVQPIQKRIEVPFDRLIWRLADYPRTQLITRRDALEAGMVLLPATRKTRIQADDVSVPALNELLAGGSGRRSDVEILTLRRVHPNTHRYYPIKLLVFGDVTRGDVSVAICVDGDLSQAHDLALGQLGGAERLAIRLEAPASRPQLGAELESIRVPTEETGGRSGLARQGEQDRDVEVADAAAIEAPPVETIPVRGVAVFEHRELLDDALESARERLLIISPWVRAAVVDTNFRARLEQRLRAGVRVHIAHGFGDDDSGSDVKVLKQLENLQTRFPGSFTLARLANTHAKILIYDARWISTSFNWLSFKGDADRTYRMEEGTLVQIQEQVDKQYLHYVSVIEDQRVDLNRERG